MSVLPAGAALTSWANAWLRGAVSFDAAVDALADAGIATVRGLPDNAGVVPIGWALTELRTHDERVWLVLPAPGDIRGVPPMPGLAAVAVQAGQLVRGSRLALTPDPDPSAESGWLAWDLRELSVIPAPAEQLTLAQAAGTLRMATVQASDLLGDLDVARWNPAAAELLRRPDGRRLPLPPDHDREAALLVARAQALLGILDLAGADAPGAALSASAAASREAALAPLRVVVRDALAVAISHPAVPDARPANADITRSAPPVVGERTHPRS